MHRTALGAAPICTWNSETELEIVLGFGATVLPGDHVILRGGLKTANGASDLSPDVLAEISAPVAAQVPCLPKLGTLAT
eukprot:3618078-Rhodomonas_salina.11